jgi:hypothetical protein
MTSPTPSPQKPQSQQQQQQQQQAQQQQQTSSDTSASSGSGKWQLLIRHTTIPTSSLVGWTRVWRLSRMLLYTGC